MANVFKPSFEERINWGKAEASALTDFKDGLRKFITDIQDNLKSLIGGLELKKPDKKYDMAEVRKCNLVHSFISCSR